MRRRSRKAFSAASLPIAMGVAGHLSLAATNDPHSLQPSAEANRTADPSTRSPSDTDQHRSSAIATGPDPQDASAMNIPVIASNVRIRSASQSGAVSASGREQHSRVWKGSGYSIIRCFSAKAGAQPQYPPPPEQKLQCLSPDGCALCRRGSTMSRVTGSARLFVTAMVICVISRPLLCVVLNTRHRRHFLLMGMRPQEPT